MFLFVLIFEFFSKITLILGFFLFFVLYKSMTNEKKT